MSGGSGPRSELLPQATPDQIDATHRYWRAANFLSVAQLYLLQNALLRRPLLQTDVKPLVLGHWGVCPALNFLYAHLNLAAIVGGKRVGLVVGPAHAGAALLANLFLEGTLGETYEDLRCDEAGANQLVRTFGAESRFLTEISPLMPGVVYQGGELGHSLAVAQGTVLDRPGSIVACFIGDGEAETGGIAGAWPGGRFLHPRTCGAVLPVVNLNGFKVGSASLLAQMSDSDIRSYFLGCGYLPLVVGPDHRQMHAALMEALSIINQSSSLAAGEPFSGPWPAILLQTPKGWTGPREFDGVSIDGTLENHKAPLTEASTCDRQLRAIEAWLHSYEPLECFDEAGRPSPTVAGCIPPRALQVGSYFVDLAETRLTDRKLPDAAFYSLTDLGSAHSPTTPTARYLGALLRDNVDETRFRFFSPDEIESTKFELILNDSSRTLMWSSGTEHDLTGRGGRVMEVLNEPLCLGWLIGYLVTGGTGVLVTYEGFAPILASMVMQYMRFLELWKDASWTRPIAALNIVLTSLCWRNSYSHQNPDFIGLLLGKGHEGVSVYTPYDGNAFLSSVAHGLQQKNGVNLYVVSKTELPLHSLFGQAERDVKAGCTILKGCGTGTPLPDVVLAVCGDYLLPEAFAAVRLAEETLPGLQVQLVYVSRLSSLGKSKGAERCNEELTDAEFEELFPRKTPVVFAFTGYAVHVKGLLFDRPSSSRFQVHGYRNVGMVSPRVLLEGVGLDRVSLAARLLKMVPKDGGAHSGRNRR